MPFPCVRANSAPLAPGSLTTAADRDAEALAGPDELEGVTLGRVSGAGASPRGPVGGASGSTGMREFLLVLKCFEGVWAVFTGF